MKKILSILAVAALTSSRDVRAMTVTLGQGGLFGPNCQTYLDRTPVDDDRLVAESDRVYAWLSMRHPILRRALARTDDLEFAFDLVFLTTGFRIPPHTRLGPGPANRTYQHWLRTVSPAKVAIWTGKGHPGKPMTRTEASVARLLSEHYSWIAFRKQHDFLPLTPAELRQKQILTILTDGVGLMRDLTSPHNRSGGENSFRKDIHFKTPGPQIEGATEIVWVDLHLKRAFTELELTEIEAMYESVASDREVRVHLVHRLHDQLDRLDAEQRTLCRRLSFCTTVKQFNSIFNATKGAAADVPRRAGGNTPPQFSREDLAAFLETRQPFEAGEPVERAALFDLMTDLNRAADLLGQALMQLDAWRADRFEWSDWRDGLRPTVEAIAELRFSLSARSAEIARAKANFEEAAQEILRLAEWVARSNDYVFSLEKEAETLANLPGSQRIALKSILATLPALTLLMERAVGSIRTRNEIMVTQMAAIASLLLSVADLAEDRLRRPNADDRLETDEKFIGLRRLLGELAEQGRAE